MRRTFVSISLLAAALLAGSAALPGGARAEQMNGAVVRTFDPPAEPGQLTPHPRTRTREPGTVSPPHPGTETRTGEGNLPQATVSWGLSVLPIGPLLRTEDLTPNRGRPTRDCSAIEAKIARLEAIRDRLNRALAILLGDQNVPYTDSITGASTRFVNGGSPDFAVSRLMGELDETGVALGRYIRELKACQGG
jgi:hypothetical protein